MSKKIKYRGVITEIHSGNLQVEIRDETACDVCAARKSCCMSGKREKRLDIPFASGDYRPGDEVTVVGKTSMGLKAIFIAFVLPLMLILVILMGASSMGANEQQAALISLSAMILYFFGIFLLKNKIKQTFTFIIDDKTIK